jgi:lipid II:glycine glycyltransferase (peptidoglycan interpeptide bridge formation enzyme)
MRASEKPLSSELLPRYRLTRFQRNINEAGENQNTRGEERLRSFMQSPFWARFKVNTGWKAYLFDLYDRPASDDPLVVLVRPLALGLSFAYIPHGPELPKQGSDKGAYLENLAKALLANLKDRILFLRFDLDWELEKDCSAGEIFGSGSRLRKGSAVQVPDTTVLDLGLEKIRLLEGMKPKWRYNIRLAEKRGVQVERLGAQALPTFYKLYQETASRDGIAIHPLSYYEKLFATVAEEGSFSGCEVKPEIALWVASHESQPLAAIITLFLGKGATYLYGASSDEKRNLMPSYALQWAAIQAAKDAGCESYDFFGIPPTGEPGHPMTGLYLFKTGFGGRVVHRIGAVDYPAMPLLFGLFSAAERIRLFWYKRIRKILSRSRS